MSCYPCTHCNKCGIYSTGTMKYVCAQCGADVAPGSPGCIECGCRELKLISVASDTSEADEQEASDL